MHVSDRPLAWEHRQIAVGVRFCPSIRGTFFITIHSSVSGFLTLFVSCSASSPFRVTASTYGTSLSHSLDKPHSVLLPWMSDRPDAETSAWEHIIVTSDRHPCPRRVSNSHCHQERGLRLRGHCDWLLERQCSEFRRSTADEVSDCLNCCCYRNARKCHLCLFDKTLLRLDIGRSVYHFCNIYRVQRDTQCSCTD